MTRSYVLHVVYCQRIKGTTCGLFCELYTILHILPIRSHNNTTVYFDFFTLSLYYKVRGIHSFTLYDSFDISILTISTNSCRRKNVFCIFVVDDMCAKVVMIFPLLLNSRCRRRWTFCRDSKGHRIWDLNRNEISQERERRIRDLLSWLRALLYTTTYGLSIEKRDFQTREFPFNFFFFPLLYSRPEKNLIYI